MKVLQLIVIWLGFSKVQFMVMVKVGWNYPPTYTHCLKKLVFLTKIVPLLKTTVTALCSPCIWNLAMTSTRRHCQIFLMFFFFLLSLVTDPSFMSLLVLELWPFLFMRNLTRNAETENTPVWVLLNVWRLGKLGYQIGHECI